MNEIYVPVRAVPFVMRDPQFKSVQISGPCPCQYGGENAEVFDRWDEWCAQHGWKNMRRDSEVARFHIGRRHTIFDEKDPFATLIESAAHSRHNQEPSVVEVGENDFPKFHAYWAKRNPSLTLNGSCESPHGNGSELPAYVSALLMPIKKREDRLSFQPGQLRQNFDPYFHTQTHSERNKHLTFGRKISLASM
ncbi:hypothetical protein B0H12DRAFT_1076334 [Mycena haematopus]|nr:hypothetical protein B0H12DRAFT_1076334 [Mycena haematopus]